MYYVGMAWRGIVHCGYPFLLFPGVTGLCVDVQLPAALLILHLI